MPRIDVKLDDIPYGQLVRLEGREVPLVAIRINGSIRVFVDRCPHAQWPLSNGELKDGFLHCVGHGWQFNVHTGHCVTVPVCSLKPIPAFIEHNILRIEWSNEK
jgi:nitrite reductase/ring-hydroxylating ferredoxin subunit